MADTPWITSKPNLLLLSKTVHTFRNLAFLVAVNALCFVRAVFCRQIALLRILRMLHRIVLFLLKGNLAVLVCVLFVINFTAA